MERKVYGVRTVPEGKFWVLCIDGLPEGMACTTQALREKGDRDIEEMARDFIALSLEVDAYAFDLVVTKESEGEKV